MKVCDCDHTHVHVRRVSLVGLPAAGYAQKVWSPAGGKRSWCRLGLFGAVVCGVKRLWTKSRS